MRIHQRNRLFALALLTLVTALGACKKDPEPASAGPSALEAKQRAEKAAQLLDVPRDRIYAASAHLRVIDVAVGQVVAGLNLQRAITGIAFSTDGRRAFVAASDGVREIDVEETKLLRQLTSSPARQVLRSLGGDQLFVLEHDVPMVAGQPKPSAFRLLTLSVETGKVERTEEIGPRILAVVPSLGPDRHHLVLEESMRVVLGKAGTKLAAGEPIDLAAGLPSKTLVVRPYLVLSDDGTHAFVPVEGEPSRIIDVDLVRGTSSAISIEKQRLIRGLAVSSDAKRLFVNTADALLIVELGSRKITGELALDAPHTGLVLSSDQRRAYLAQTVHEDGGAVTIVLLDPLRVQGKIHLADISPWVIAVQPRAGFAAR